MTITIDLETKSDIDLTKAGVYKYTESIKFEILLFSYSVDGSEVQVIDLANGEKIPDEIISALTDESIIKRAFNVNFERICLSKYLGKKYLSPVSWQCSMIHARTLGLPSSLAEVGEVLRIEQQKMSEGKALIKYFCVPDKEGKFHEPSKAHDKWELFKQYNKRDVEAEIDIDRRLSNYPVPDFIWDEFYLDQQINDRGILIDMELAEAAICLDEQSNALLTADMKRLTGIDNPNSVYQLLEWLKEQGYKSDSLGKKEVLELIKTAKEPVRTVLEKRLQLSRSSVKKYRAMKLAACSDNRARGMFSFYGASRSGRWAGRNIQLQNLPHNHIPDLTTARDTVKYGYFDEVEMLYDNVPNTLSQLIRTAFIPKRECKFIVADFSAIEARVIAWLAGEQWRMKAFADGEDIYCALASQIFGVPVKKNGINGHLRQKGKVAELACIAEGQLVLTNHGLIPIENVSVDDLLWDGEKWVHHEGVVFKGEREVITYEGLIATPDHLVWIEGESKPVQFGFAAAIGAHLIQTGNGRRAIRLGENNKPGKEMEQKNESLLCIDGMSELWFDTMAKSRQSDFREVKRLSTLFEAASDTTMVGQKTYCCKAKMRKSQRCRLSELRRKRNKIQFPKCNSSRNISHKNLWYSESENGNRSDKQQWQLRTGKYSICNAYRKQQEQTYNDTFKIRSKILAICRNNCNSEIIKRNDKRRDYYRCGKCCDGKKKMLAFNIGKARLYDIRNAGRYHRFTVSGKLVHNCGYGGSVGAMKAMGGGDLNMTDDELKQLVDEWRVASPNIVSLWHDIENTAKTAIICKDIQYTHGLTFTCKSGMLFITLPSGRFLSYARPHFTKNRFGQTAVAYMGVGDSKHWQEIETFGGKLTENIVQAIARDLLCYAMKTLSKYSIVAHVHDEIIIEYLRNIAWL